MNNTENGLPHEVTTELQNNSNVEVKPTENIEQTIENTEKDNKINTNNEEKKEEKIKEKVEEKVEDKIKDKVEKVEEKVEEKIKEKGKEKAVEEEEEEKGNEEDKEKNVNIINGNDNAESSGSSNNQMKESTEKTEVISNNNDKINNKEPLVSTNNKSKEEKEKVKEENLYKLKVIEKRNEYQGIIQQKNIITQNINGPCPLLALCNILILRGDISIPLKKKEITYEEIIDILGDYIARNTGNNDNNNDNNDENNFQDVWDIIPTLKKGLDINVKFDSVQSFEPSPALTVFKFFNIKLVHGWTVDPEDKETYRIIVEECGNYNKVVEKIIESDSACASKDSLNNNDNNDNNENDNNNNDNNNDNNNNNNENQESINTIKKREELYHTGIVCKNFIESTASQLTYHGLTSIPDVLSVNEPTAFFRNNHFLTLIKTPDNNMYTLVTDQGFVNEKKIVWESLSTIDGDSFFVDGLFNKYINKSSNNDNGNGNGGSGGDDLMLNTPNEDLDYALALSLQEDEENKRDEMIKRMREENKRMREENRRLYENNLNRNHHHHSHYYNNNDSNKNINRHQNSRRESRRNSRRNNNNLNNNNNSTTNKSKPKESDDDKCLIM